MKIIKADFLRVLRIAYSIGNPEVKFDEDGFFGVASRDRGALVFGHLRIPFGKEMAFTGVDLLIKHLDCFSCVEVNAELYPGQLVLAGDGNSIHRFRLAKPEFVVSYDRDMLQYWSDYGGLVEVVQYEKLKALADTMQKIKADQVRFYSEQGYLMATGGNAEGVADFVLGSLFLDKPICVNASKLVPVLSRLDESHIKLTFGLFEEVGFVKIEQMQSGFVWFIGALTSDGQTHWSERQLPALPR